MKALIINTGTIQDLKLVAETDADITFLKVLNEAGTLSLVTPSVGSSATFRPITVVEEDFSGNTANASNSIGRFNFDIRQNEFKSFDFSFSSEGTPVNLAMYDTISLQVKSSRSSSPIISLTLLSGLEVIGDNNEKLRITFTPEQTEKLLLPTYFYDILFEWGGNNSYSVEGVINVIPSVTR